MKKLFDIDRVTENPRSQIQWREEQIKYILRSYKQGQSIKKLSKDFKVHPNSIKLILEKNNINIRSLRESRKNEKTNSSIFKKIDTEEKAYWLGFLAADGNVYTTKISSNLQYSDRNHLKKFNNFLGNPTEVKYTSQFRNGKEFKYCSIAVYSAEMAEDLIKHGVVKNKSLILEPPLFLTDKKLQLSWIRGYFDGDGGVSITEKPRRAQMYCTGTYKVLKWIVEVLDLNTEPFLEHRCKKTYRIHRNGWNICRDKLSLLYEDATIFLDRKYNLYLKLKVPNDTEIRRQLFYEEAVQWAKNNKTLVLNCSNTNIFNPLHELFELGKKYNFSDRRAVSQAICRDRRTKVMLQHLKSLLQQ